MVASDCDLRGIKADVVIKDYDRGDWGHEKRAIGLQEATKTWIGFFNADDEYEDTFIEKLITPGYDFVYCDFTSHLFKGNTVRSKLSHGNITSGNFIVKRSLANKVGYEHREYHADWLFIKDLLELNPKTKHVPEVLYKHL